MINNNPDKYDQLLSFFSSDNEWNWRYQVNNPANDKNK